jgi:hypothetical protein
MRQCLAKRAVLGRPARPNGRLGNEGFEADHVERGDETAQRFGDRIVRASKGQKALDVAPASLHRVERVVCHANSARLRHLKSIRIHNL